MIKIFITLFILTIASVGMAENDSLICKTISTGSYNGGISISCVSKASIEKDIQELKVLKLQEEKISLELEQLKAKIKSNKKE